MGDFIESSALFGFKFDGEDTISANTLITSINNIIDLLSETTKTKDETAYAKLNIKAIKSGSFDMLFQVIINEARTLLTQENIELASAVVTILCGFFTLKKFLRGKKAKEIKKDDHSIQVTNHLDETSQFPKDIGMYFEKPSFDHSIVNIINVALSENTSGFSLSAEENVIHVKAEEYDHMSAAVVEEPAIRIQERTIKEEKLIIKKPDLLGKSQWGFRFRDNSIEASIEDLEWLQSFQDKHTPVMSGSTLIVDLRIEARIDENDMEILGVPPKYTVVKVYGDIRNPPEQIGLI